MRWLLLISAAALLAGCASAEPPFYVCEGGYEGRSGEPITVCMPVPESMIHVHPGSRPAPQSVPAPKIDPKFGA